MGWVPQAMTFPFPAVDLGDPNLQLSITDCLLDFFLTLSFDDEANLKVFSFI